MNITEISIKRKIVTLTVFFLLILAGISAYFKLEKAEDPGFAVKTTVITTMWPGATTDQMDQLVSRKIEEIVQNIGTLDYIETKNRPGMSTVYVNIVPTYKDTTDNLQDIWDEVRRKLQTEASSKLPKGIIGPIYNDEFGDVFGTMVSVTGSDYSYKELYDISETVRDKLLKIEHVGKVKIVGEQKEKIYIDFNNNKLSSMGISPSLVLNQINLQNVITPSGVITTSTDQLNVEITGNYDDVKNIGDTPISVPGKNEIVYLKDIATIKRDYIDPATYIAQYNGEKSIVLAISLKDGKNNISLGNDVTKVLNELKAKYPVGVEFNYLAYQPGIVSDKIDSFISNLIQAIVTIVIVMVISLGLRTGLIVCTLIPTVTCITFLILKHLHMGLDQMSLAGLIIALGMLVDNSIVMSENIMVMMQKGKSKMDACLDSAMELKGPLLIASLIIVAAFSPIFLAENDVGEYTAPIGIVVGICLLTSWVIANTLIPLLCYMFLKVEPQEPDYTGKWYSLYKKILLQMLKFKKITAMCAAGVFVLGIVLFKFIPVKFMPESDKPIMFSELRLPIGTSIDYTKKVVDDLNLYIKDNYKVENKQVSVNPFTYIVSGGTAKKYEKDGIYSWGAFIGGGAPRYFLPYSPEAPAPEYAYILYNVTDYTLIEKMATNIDTYVKEKYPDADIITRKLSTGPSASKDIQYRISNDNLQELFNKVDLIKAKLRTEPGVVNISDNWNLPSKKILININQEKAQNSGLTNKEIATSLQGILSGVSTSTYKENDDLIPIVIRSNDEFRNNLKILDTMEIFSSRTGNMVPLKQVANIELDFQPGFIYKRDRVYTVTVQGDVKNGYTANATDKVMIPWLNEQIQNWGSDFKFQLGGESEKGNDASKAVGEQLPMAGLLIVFLLILQFNSLKKPIIILLTIPLGILGSALGLICTGQNFGFMPLIGIISLAGVVINAAIVLIDRIDIEIEKGLSKEDAVVEACLARIRPILLTTSSTICGLIPLWLFGGTLFSPMAVTLLFGLIFATTLTLGVIPALWSIFFKADFK